MYEYVLYINNISFCFQTEICCLDFYKALFTHCTERRKLYKDLIEENFDRMQKLYDSYNAYNTAADLIKSSAIKNAMWKLIEEYGDVYDPHGNASYLFILGNALEEALEEVFEKALDDFDENLSV